MELTLNNPQTKVFFKEVFIELFQENKAFFTGVIKEVMDELGTSQSVLKNSQDELDCGKISESKAGVYYKCGEQVRSQTDYRTRSRLGSDSWGSFVENIDKYAVDTGVVTEWVETMETDWNMSVEAEQDKIVDVVMSHQWPTGQSKPVIGNGQATQKIVNILAGQMNSSGSDEPPAEHRKWMAQWRGAAKALQEQKEKELANMTHVESQAATMSVLSFPTKMIDEDSPRWAYSGFVEQQKYFMKAFGSL